MSRRWWLCRLLNAVSAIGTMSMLLFFGRMLEETDSKLVFGFIVATVWWTVFNPLIEALEGEQ